MPLRPDILNRAFSILETAAYRGERCPLNGTTPWITADITTALARAGRIKVEVSGRNWRVVTILKGPNAGKRTMPDPLNGHVYLTIGVTTEWTPRHMSQISRNDQRRREAAAQRRRAS